MRLGMDCSVVEGKELKIVGSQSLGKKSVFFSVKARNRESLLMT